MYGKKSDKMKPMKAVNRMAKPGISKKTKMTQEQAMSKGIERAMEKFRK